MAPLLTAQRHTVGDLGDGVLRFLERLMLAQAAECFYQRTVLGAQCTAGAWLAKFCRCSRAHVASRWRSQSDRETQGNISAQVAAAVARHYDDVCELFEHAVPRSLFGSKTRLPAVRP